MSFEMETECIESDNQEFDFRHVESEIQDESNCELKTQEVDPLEIDQEVNVSFIQKSLKKLISQNVIKQQSDFFVQGQLEYDNLKTENLDREINDLYEDNINYSHQIEHNEGYITNSNELLVHCDEYLDKLTEKVESIKESVKVITSSKLYNQICGLSEDYDRILLQFSSNSLNNDKIEKIIEDKIAELNNLKQICASLDEIAETTVCDDEIINKRKFQFEEYIETIKVQQNNCLKEHEAQVEDDKVILEKMNLELNESRKKLIMKKESQGESTTKLEAQLQEIHSALENSRQIQNEYKLKQEKANDILKNKEANYNLLQIELKTKKQENEMNFKELLINKASIKNEIKQITRENNTIKQKISAYQAQLLDITNKKSDSYNKTLNLCREGTNLKLQLQSLTSTNENLEKQIEDTKHEKQHLIQLIENLNQEINSLLEQNDIILKEKIRYAQELKIKITTNTDKSEIDHLDMSNQYLKGQLSDFKELTDLREKSIVNLQEENTNLKSARNKFLEEYNNLKDKINNRKKESEKEGDLKNVCFNNLVSYKSITDSESIELSSQHA